jgi:hypothetical protein
MRRKPKRPIGGDLWGFCRDDGGMIAQSPGGGCYSAANRQQINGLHGQAIANGLGQAHCQALAHSQAKAHGEAQARDSKNDFQFPILGKPFNPVFNPFGILEILKFPTRELDFSGKFFVLLFYVSMSALHYAIRMVM